MKKTSRFALVLYGACAVIWIIKIICDIVNQTIYVPGSMFVLHVICAVAWIVCFVVNLKRYLSDQEEQ